MTSDLFLRRSADLSPCGRHRYSLLRQWDTGLEPLVWVMLNPSVADASIDDPTIRRVMSFTRAAGYGAAIVLNLFTLRATDPKALWAAPAGDRNGPSAQAVLEHYLETRGLPAVAAWGAATKAKERAEEVLQITSSWRCLGVTANGSPRHPLYVPGCQALVPYAAATA